MKNIGVHVGSKVRTCQSTMRNNIADAWRLDLKKTYGSGIVEAVAHMETVCGVVWSPKEFAVICGGLGDLLRTMVFGPLTWEHCKELAQVMALDIVADDRSWCRLRWGRFMVDLPKEPVHAKMLPAFLTMMNRFPTKTEIRDLVGRCRS